MKYHIEQSIPMVELTPNTERQREVEASVLRAVRHLELKPNHLLGEGASARVYFPERGLQKTCYKVLRDNTYPIVKAFTDEGRTKIPEIYRKHYDATSGDGIPWSQPIQTESRITNRVAQLSREHVSGVSVPTIYQYFKLDGEIKKEGEFYVGDRVDVILMDRIMGKDLEQIIMGKLPLPRDFDASLFMDKLDLFVKHMNDQGIYHRDIALRNIMMDEGGNPALIDFGRSTDTTMGEDPYHIETVSGNVKTLRSFNNDIHMLGEVRKSLREYQNYFESKAFTK
jgi:serine/threonine protein kinase